eukprot:1158975-Pelagomonas_calceolata.AAC.28
MLANFLRAGLHASCQVVLAPAKPSSRRNKTPLHTHTVATHASLNSGHALACTGSSEPAGAQLQTGKKRSLRRSQARAHRPLCLAPCCANAADSQGPAETGSSGGEQPQEYILVNTYHLVDVADPRAVSVCVCLPNQVASFCCLALISRAYRQPSPLLNASFSVGCA